MSLVSKITAVNFTQEVKQHSGLVLVDFYADWCGPCKMISPVLDQLSLEREAVKIVKVNADDAPQVMAEYGVRGIPTLLLFNNGEKIGTKVGAAPLTQLKAFVDQAS